MKSKKQSKEREREEHTVRTMRDESEWAIRLYDDPIEGIEDSYRKFPHFLVLRFKLLHLFL